MIRLTHRNLIPLLGVIILALCGVVSTTTKACAADGTPHATPTERLTDDTAPKSMGDSVVIKGEFSKSDVEVGDHIDYTLTITKDRTTEVMWPCFYEVLSDEEQADLILRKKSMSTFRDYDDDIFEHIDESPIDTLHSEGRTVELRKRYRIAVMETGEVRYVPSVLFFRKNHDKPDTLYSRDTLLLNVKRYERLDTTLFLKPSEALLNGESGAGLEVDSLLAAKHLRTAGLNTQKDLPFVFAEISDYVIYGAIGLILLALLVWLIVTLLLLYIRHRKAQVKVVPLPPPHIVANKALEELSHRKLWQNGKFKLYYTELASILRQYIARRWEVGAMEMTTDEIIASLHDAEITTQSRMDLVKVLRTADMVKFAKAMPEAEENEENWLRAYYFVENTKQVDEQNKEGKEDITIETNIKD